MRLADRSLRLGLIRLAVMLPLGMALSGCGGEVGSVHFDKPLDTKSIGAPPRRATPPTARPGSPAKKKSNAFIPG